VFPMRNPYNSSGMAERVLVAVGAALIIVCPYLPWLHVIILGDFNLTGLLSAAHGSAAIAYLVSALGLGLLLVALLARSMEGVRVTALVAGSIVLLVGAWATYGLIRAVSSSAGFGQVGVGPIMGVVGGILLVVPPIVGYAQRPPVPFVPGRKPWRNPFWIPAAAALVIAIALAWMPYHAGVSNYCGTAVGAAFKSNKPIPSDNPPADVESQLHQDQAAVAAAQAAIAGQQQGDTQAAQQQNTAAALSAQAQQADTNASDLEATVSEDQGTLDGDQATVDGDKSTVQADQESISSDQSSLQTDQQMLATDQASGSYTGSDRFAIQQDQQNLSRDQANLAKDQQTLNSDQATLKTAQAKLASDQKALSAAQTQSSQLDQQAQNAETSAQSASSNAAQQDASSEQQLDHDQRQLASDQADWNDTYVGDLAAAHDYNANLSHCQGQADGHFIAIGIILALGTALTLFLLRNRRRQVPPPPTWFPPAGVTG
jgi:hypothetical protein